MLIVFKGEQPEGLLSKAEQFSPEGTAGTEGTEGASASASASTEGTAADAPAGPSVPASASAAFSRRSTDVREAEAFTPKVCSTSQLC